MHPEDVQEFSEKHLCAGCIGESHLRGLVEKENDEHKCSYCGDNAPAISLEELAGRVETASKRILPAQPVSRIPGSTR